MGERGGGGLLECLLRKTGASYLSDLRLDPQLAEALRSALESFPAERFARGQWADAVYYLTRAVPSPEEDAASLRGHLLERLGRSAAGGAGGKDPS